MLPPPATGLPVLGSMTPDVACGADIVVGAGMHEVLRPFSSVVVAASSIESPSSNSVTEDESQTLATTAALHPVEVQICAAVQALPQAEQCLVSRFKSAQWS